MYPRKTKKGGQVKQYGKGRVCKKHGCTHRLSIYNPEEFCYRHYKECLK